MALALNPALTPFTLDISDERVAKGKQSDSYDGNPPRVVDPYGPGAVDPHTNRSAQGSGYQYGNNQNGPPARTVPSQLAASTWQPAQSQSTPNTRHVQDTGLGPSVTNPGADNGLADPTNTPNPFVEIGASGLVQYGGFVRDEFLPQLQGEKGLRVWREMWDNDPVVGALVFMIQMLMRKVEWRVEPPEAATVAGIVQAREKENQKVQEQRREAQRAALLGTTPTGGGASSMGGPGGNGAPGGSPMQRPAGASPAQQPDPGPAFHEPLPGLSGGEGAGGTGVGLPGDRPPHLPGPDDPGSDSETGGLQKFPVSKVALDHLAEWIAKAGSGEGMSAGDIDATSVGPFPIDPETNEPMVFPEGTGPFAPPTPQEQHAEYLAAFVESCLHDCAEPWSDIISQIVTMIVYGFSFHELVYKFRRGPNPDNPTQGSRYEDGWIGWAKIAGRAQETTHRWEFDDNGNVIGMWQLAPPKFQLKYIPLSKALLFRTTGYKQNPQGRSVLRSAYRPWYLKRRIEEIEAIGIERNLAGLPVAYVPYQWLSIHATEEEKQALAEVKNIVRNVRNNEQAGLVFPTILDYETKHPLFEFQLLSSSSGASSKVVDTDKVITRYDQRIAMVALVDFILLGMENSASRSLADVKADLFTTALEAWLSVIADVFNNHAIPCLMLMNGESPAMAPRLTFGKLTRISITEIGALLTALAGAGADLFPDPILEDRIREAAGLPPKAATNDL